MTTFSGSFSTTDTDKTIRPKKDPVDEVIDILTDPTGGSGPPSARAMRNVSAASPQVNVQQVKSLTPTYQGSNVPVGSLETDRDKIIDDAIFDNQLRRAMGMLPSPTSGTVDLGGAKATSTILNSLAGSDPGLALKYQQAGKTPVQGAGPFSLQSLGLRREGDSLRPDSPRGIAGPYEAMDPNMFDQDTGDIFGYMNYINSLDAGQGQAQPQVPPQISKASSMPPQNLIDQMNPTGLAGIAQGILGSLTGSSPAIYNLTDEYGDPLGGDNFGLGRKFDNPDTARRLGFIPVGRDAGGNIVYDVDPAITKSQEDQEKFSRLDDERRERAAMLAAQQQQQPVDPCPEGYRMDPVSKVCVPVDDTIDTDPVKRTYDTMTRPEPNYTPATGFTLPAITLPDILG